MNDGNGQGSSNQRVSELLAQFRRVSTPGGSAAGPAERMRRNELLDEIQEAVGLGGKMVTERDIVQRAQAMTEGGSNVRAGTKETR